MKRKYTGNEAFTEEDAKALDSRDPWGSSEALKAQTEQLEKTLRALNSVPNIEPRASGSGDSNPFPQSALTDPIVVVPYDNTTGQPFSWTWNGSSGGGGAYINIDPSQLTAPQPYVSDTTLNGQYTWSSSSPWPDQLRQDPLTSARGLGIKWRDLGKVAPHITLQSTFRFPLGTRPEIKYKGM